MLLPRNPWASKLEQRAAHVAQTIMHHPAVGAGHFLYSLTIAESYELPARRFNQQVHLDAATVQKVVALSQTARLSLPTMPTPLTHSGGQVVEIASRMAEERYRRRARPGGPQIIPDDFIVGVLLSGDESVDYLMGLSGLEVESILERLDITLASSVIDLRVNS